MVAPSRTQRRAGYGLLLLAVLTLAWARTLPLALDAVDARIAQTAVTGNRAALVDEIKDEYRYRGADGREHVYLGHLDSYVWLRNARNYLETGTSCDAVVDGVCRDTFALAPVGTRMRYGRSLHIAAIVALHRVITLFSPEYPLPSTAFWIQVLVGAACALPAFGLGRMLVGERGGNLGGFAAAIAIGLSPVFLQRSLGSDNDVWNILLPLCMAWAAAHSLFAARVTGCAGWALASAVFAGLHAVTWRGWMFAYGVLLTGLLAYLVHLVIAGIAPAARRRVLNALGRGLLATGIFYAATGVFVTATGVESDYLAIPREVLSSAIQRGSAIAALDSPPPKPAAIAPTPKPTPKVERPRPAEPDGNDGRREPPAVSTPGPVAERGVVRPAELSIGWPSNFSGVLELSAPGIGGIVSNVGGPILFLLASLGLLSAFLPRAGWRWWHLLVLGGAALLDTFLIGSSRGAGATARAVDLNTLGAGLALPVIAAIVIGWCEATRSEQERSAASTGVALIVAAWFFAGLMVAYDAVRFVVLLVPGFGLALAAGLGRLHGWLDGELMELTGRARSVARTLAFIGVAAVLILPGREGLATARSYQPRINDAWWDTLIGLRDHTPPDSIVTTWWDFGYWTKYVAERRVNVDGGSLTTHVPHWIGRALLASTEAEAVGLLRMLDCGSDATPEPEGRLGAYGKLRRRGLDSLAAHRVITELAPLDRGAADARLERLGLPETAREDVLASTHCAPPPGYLVLASSMIESRNWRSIGSFDFGRAYAERRVRERDGQTAVDDIVARLDIPVVEAAALARRARTMQAERRGRDFVAPSQGFWVDGWQPCERNAAGGLRCSVGRPIDRQGTRLEEIVYDAQTLERLPLRLTLRAPGARAGAATLAGKPGLLLLAGAAGLESVEAPGASHPELAVLLDSVEARVLVGPPYLVRSLFTQLLMLDGRYAQRFEKFDDRGGRLGERVATWRIRWNDD